MGPDHFPAGEGEARDDRVLDFLGRIQGRALLGLEPGKFLFETLYLALKVGDLAIQRADVHEHLVFGRRGEHPRIAQPRRLVDLDVAKPERA